MLANVLTTLSRNNLLNSATKEVGGSNIPHILLVQNKNELIDQAINQFGNTAVVMGGTYLADRCINRLFGRLNKSNFSKSKFLNQTSNQWFILGKSFALYSFIASYVIASPFLRNFITFKRTKANSFAEVVGLSQNHKPDSEQEIKRNEKRYLNRFLKTWGSGLALSSGLLALTQFFVTKKIPFPSFLKPVQRYLGLPNGEFRHFKDLQVFLFWAIPAYLGLYTASRDKLEKKETLYKAAGFGLAFIILPNTLRRISQRFLQGKTFKVIGPGENMAFLIQLLSGILFYASIPTVINRFKRKSRAQEYGLMQGAPIPRSKLVPVFQSPTLGVNPWAGMSVPAQVAYPVR